MYIETSCAGNPDLRARVEKLMADQLNAASHSAAAEFSETIVQSRDSTGDSASSDEPAIVIGSSLQLALMASHPSPQRLGDYELYEVLGQGGMGVVRKGFDCKLRRVVAIKTLSPVFASHPQSRQRFLREAQAAAAVRHDNVVTIYSVNEDAESPFLVMECITGTSLQQFVDGAERLSVGEIVRIAMQIAAGLEAAHLIGLVHRDIKPSNILLEGETRRVKITDFGLARVVSDVGLTKSGQVAGTPQYMSPEQALGQVVDHRSDLFSLGTVMYSMCTATSPFHAETAVVVLRRVCDDKPVAVRTLRPDIPEWLCKVIDKLMSKRPGDRFQSAGELRALLHERLAVEPRPDPSNDVPRASSSNKTRIAAVVLSVLILLGLLSFGLPHVLRTDSASPASISNPANIGNQKAPAEAIPPIAASVKPVVVVQPVAEKPDWVSLIHDGEPAAGGMRRGQVNWSVEGTTLKGEAINTSGLLSVLSHAPKRFHLRSEARLVGPGNAGFNLAVREQGRESQGFQIDIHPSETGSIAELTPWKVLRRPKNAPDIKDQWFTLEIVRTEASLTSRVNGVHAVTVPISTNEQVGIDLELDGRTDRTAIEFRRLELRALDDRVSQFPATGFALQFDGQTSYVKIPSLSRHEEGPSTLECWIHTEFQTHSKVVLLVSGKSHMQIGKTDNYLFIGSRNISLLDPAACPEFTSGHWQHVALVSTDRELRFYVNGVRRAQTANTQQLRQPEYPFDGTWIGAHPLVRDLNQNAYFYRGRIDEIRISKSARYDLDFTPQTRFEPDADTVALYHCDEGAGTALQDSTGNKHHGQIISAKWVNQQDEPTGAADLALAEAQAQRVQKEWSHRLGVPVEVSNSIDMKLRLIPPGEFLMGASETDPDALAIEKPQHTVTLTSPWYLGATEVTVGQFRKFVEAEKYVTEAESDGEGAYHLQPKERRRENVWKSIFPVAADTEAFPVTCVSWQDARNFCAWLSKQERAIYRLPTEAEWEYACRAVTKTRYSFGDAFDPEKANSAREGNAVIRPVAQYPANPFGLFDMHGNVNEMCQDMGMVYANEAKTDPIGPEGETVVVRGGAASSNPIRLRSSNRYLNDRRSFPEANFATTVKGFRVVRELNAPAPANPAR